MASQIQALNSNTTSPSLSPAQHVYQTTLQKTLLAELEFLMNVVHGRIQDRKTIQLKIKELLVQGICCQCWWTISFG